MLVLLVDVVAVELLVELVVEPVDELVVVDELVEEVVVEHVVVLEDVDELVLVLDEELVVELVLVDVVDLPGVVRQPDRQHSSVYVNVSKLTYAKASGRR